MMCNIGRTLMAAILVFGCATAPKPLVLSEEAVTEDGLHRVMGDESYSLYMAPAFTEKARTGGFKGKGLYIRSCNVTFADSDQEALFSPLHD